MQKCLLPVLALLLSAASGCALLGANKDKDWVSSPADSEPHVRASVIDVGNCLRSRGFPVPEKPPRDIQNTHHLGEKQIGTWGWAYKYGDLWVHGLAWDYPGYVKTEISTDDKGTADTWNREVITHECGGHYWQYCLGLGSGHPAGVKPCVGRSWRSVQYSVLPITNRTSCSYRLGTNGVTNGAVVTKLTRLGSGVTEIDFGDMRAYVAQGVAVKGLHTDELLALYGQLQQDR